jgi:hypothetical protein
MIYVSRNPLGSLRRLRDKDTIDILSVQAPLKSWEGLEDLAGLIAIEVIDPRFFPPGEGAGPIGRCRALRTLTLSIDDQTAGLTELAALQQLKYLNITYLGSTGVNLDQTWLSQLTSLEELHVLAPEGRSIEVPLQALSALPALRSIELHGVYPAKGPGAFSSGFAALEHLEYSPMPARQAERPDTRPEVLRKDDGTFLVWIALPELMGLEDSEEATDRLEAVLAEESPVWARELTFAPETESAAVTAANREPIESLLEWIESRFGGGA